MIRISMADSTSRARLLAPAALAIGAILLLLILFSSGGGSGSKGGSSGTSRGGSRSTSTSSGRLPQRIYIIKPGDSLSIIGTKTGIPVAKLQALNPEIDPQALISGQKIKLR